MDATIGLLLPSIPARKKMLNGRQLEMFREPLFLTSAAMVFMMNAGI
ncbi:MAG TPA: hypothetical protein VM802_24640 [Chitinophaga sp.]|nr:hypothetical protein [Chitinophaga sp.]HVI48078.1 hypothetical protein [Chitinophaga sp.]